jgi:UPF0755 protein
LLFISSIIFIEKQYILKDGDIVIEKNQTVSSTIKNLKNKGFINCSMCLKIKYKINKFSGKSYKLNAGEFNLRKGMTYQEAISLLSSNKYKMSFLTFPEGLTAFHMIEILNKSKIKGEAVENQNILEGSLMPETYSYNYFETKKDIAKRMIKDMEDSVEHYWKQNKNPAIKTKQELVILASIVEKETNNDNEFDLVASVFSNRLIKNMPLQADPTIIYEITKGKENFGKPITKTDIRSGKDYNTYIKSGLPIGPICSPSRKALAACVKLPTSKYLYFVATGDNDGKHRFAETYTDHKENVKIYREKRLSPI